MPRAIASLISASLVLAVIGCASPRERVVRFATFNASLNRERAGQLVEDLSTPDNAQARNVAEVIQRVRPDVLLINEFDFEESGRAPELFQKNYLSVSQNGAEPIEYPHRVYLPVNTGVPSGHDLDNDGRVVTDPGTRGYGNDCFGFGQFPGQYGMLLLSRYPIEENRIRTFQRFKWKDMPGAMLPRNGDGTPWYTADELTVLKLSSKSHWDVPLKIWDTTVRVLVSHPTPPAFDGPEDRNGKRNHDEIRLWREFIHDYPYDMLAWLRPPHYLVDDQRGSPAVVFWHEPFVLLGDLNADPHDGG